MTFQAYVRNRSNMLLFEHAPVRTCSCSSSPGLPSRTSLASDVESRKAWMPKNIDELRVASNPKQSYQGVTLGAYAGPGRTEPGKMGKMEKNKRY